VDLNTQGLLTNYSSTNFRLAMSAQDGLHAITQELDNLKKIVSPSDSVKSRIATLTKSRAEKVAFAEKYLNLNARILPHEWRVYYYTGQLYSEIGDLPKAEEAMRKGMEAAGGGNSRIFAMNLAQLYSQNGQGAKAESVLVDLYSKSPDDFEGMYTLEEMYQRSGNIRKARMLLADWLSRNPSHQYAGQIQQMIQQYDMQMHAQQAKDTGRPGGIAAPKS